MTGTEKEALAYLLDKAKGIEMSEDQVTEQRRSFAFGNSSFENAKITRRMIDEEAEKLGL